MNRSVKQKSDPLAVAERLLNDKRDKILYVEAQNQYCHVWLVGDSTPWKVTKSLSVICRAATYLVRTHHSYAVNIKFIDRLFVSSQVGKSSSLKLTTGLRVPVSPAKLLGVRSRIERSKCSNGVREIDYNYETHPDTLSSWLESIGGLPALLEFCQCNAVQVYYGTDGMAECWIGKGQNIACYAADMDTISSLIIGVKKYLERKNKLPHADQQSSTHKVDQENQSNNSSIGSSGHEADTTAPEL